MAQKFMSAWLTFSLTFTFTEKGEQTAATDLFSLYDFSVRKDMKVEKGYLIGRFGAIPFIKGDLQNSTRTATQKMKTCDIEAP